jgi:hypothetical protein
MTFREGGSVYKQSIQILVTLVGLAFLLGSVPSSYGQEKVAAPFNDSILAEDLKADLFFFASDSMKGRLTATPENLIAAEYIKSKFERLGLKPVGDGDSYYQTFNLIRATLGEDNLLEVTHSENASTRLRPGQDYYPHRSSASGRVKGPVVYAGFGITAPKLGYDDFKGDSFKGKIVLVLDNEPGAKDPRSPFEGIIRSQYSSSLLKALTAQKKGAIGILFVQDIHNQTGPRNFEAQANRYWPEQPGRRQRYNLATRVEDIRIPVAQISPSLAEALVQGTNRSLEELAREAETPNGMTPLPLPGFQVELTTSVERHIVYDRNVVGLVEGTDETLKDEWVILCAHYDHVGVDAGGNAFNGADDDGSGTVALFEIAEAYALAAEEGIRPRRSVLFAAWNSEEVGLLGAWAYAENPLTPLSKTVAVLNMDMIGRNEEVPESGGRRFRGLKPQTAESNRNSVIIGGDTYSDLLSEAEKANQITALKLKTGLDQNPSNLIRRSDQWPFLQKEVPALFFTTGLHPDYHTINDDPEKINYPKYEKIVRLVHQLSWNLANQDGRPKMNADRLKATTNP